MNRLMYLAVCILALGFTACKSDDDNFDCNASQITFANISNAYFLDNTTATCSAFKTAIEEQIANNCFVNDTVVTGLQEQLRVLGDCTFAGRVCLLCTNSNVTEQVCRGENGNAFIDDRDLEIPFERYVELSNCQ